MTCFLMRPIIIVKTIIAAIEIKRLIILGRLASKATNFEKLM